MINAKTYISRIKKECQEAKWSMTDFPSNYESSRITNNDYADVFVIRKNS